MTVPWRLPRHPSKNSQKSALCLFSMTKFATHRLSRISMCEKNNVGSSPVASSSRDSHGLLLRFLQELIVELTLEKFYLWAETCVHSAGDEQQKKNLTSPGLISPLVILLHTITVLLIFEDGRNSQKSALYSFCVVYSVASWLLRNYTRGIVWVLEQQFSQEARY